MQQLIACIIYYVIVLIVPLKQTYAAMKADSEQKTVGLWANYWALFCLIAFIQSYLGFLTYQPFKFLFMLFFLWCYHVDYKGALFIGEQLRNIIKSNPAIVNVLNMIHQKAPFLNIFEEKIEAEGKAKTN